MYKYLSITLFFIVLILGGFLFWSTYCNSQTETELNNQISQLQGIVQETETAFSVMAIEVKDLTTLNKDLQTIIERKNEDIVALSRAVLTWKNKYFEIKNAQDSIVDDNGNPTDLSPDCEACLEGKRFRVDFEQEKDNLKISGFTLTNPGEAALLLEWTKPLTLDVILSKDKRGYFHLYLDPNTENVVPSELSLLVDSSVLEKWYEKFSINSGLYVGKGVFSSIGLGYNFKDVNVSFSTGFFYDGQSSFQVYGVNVGWYPWKR